MKIRKEKETPSTVLVRVTDGDHRRYWTGTEWSEELGDAKRYLRAVAEKKFKKGSLVITIGFRGAD